MLALITRIFKAAKGVTTLAPGKRRTKIVIITMLLTIVMHFIGISDTLILACIALGGSFVVGESAGDIVERKNK